MSKLHIFLLTKCYFALYLSKTSNSLREKVSFNVFDSFPLIFPFLWGIAHFVLCSNPVFKEQQKQFAPVII